MKQWDSAEDSLRSSISSGNRASGKMTFDLEKWQSGESTEYSILRSIAPNWISGDFDGSGDMDKAIRWAIITDSMINTEAVTKNGILNFIYQSRTNQIFCK